MILGLTILAILAFIAVGAVRRTYNGPERL